MRSFSKHPELTLFIIFLVISSLLPFFLVRSLLKNTQSKFKLTSWESQYKFYFLVCFLPSFLVTVFSFNNYFVQIPFIEQVTGKNDILIPFIFFFLASLGSFFIGAAVDKMAIPLLTFLEK